jgi:hypothetical protein
VVSNRIYLQSTSDDASHDEALSSRIAALNMLDLGLEHLDVHVGDAGPELDLVVKACGDSRCPLAVLVLSADPALTFQELTQLDTSSPSPAGKAAILVEAHKIVVGERRPIQFMAIFFTPFHRGVIQIATYPTQIGG